MSDKKLAICRLPRARLANLLNLPPSVQVDVVSYCDHTGDVVMRLSGDGLPDTCSMADKPDHSHLVSVRLWYKATTAVTFDEPPRKVDYIEFDTFS